MIADFLLISHPEPNADSVIQKNDLLKRCISMFENLSTSYIGDIEEIAKNVH
jgi:hypothetical protein